MYQNRGGIQTIVRRELLVCVLLLLSVMVFLPGEVEAAATIYSTQNGWWQNATTWLGGVVPGTTDTAYICNGHTVHLNDNRTVFQIGINTTAIFLIRGSSSSSAAIGWSITLTYDDTASAGFVQAGAGQLITLGDETNNYPVTITSAATPPTNYWVGTPKINYLKWTLRNTTFQYGKQMRSSSTVCIVDNVTISNFAGTDAIWFNMVGTTTVIDDLAIDSTSSTEGFITQTNFASNKPVVNNLVISSFTGTYEVKVRWTRDTSMVHFNNSNFDLTKVRLDQGDASNHPNAHVSLNHNDVADAYKIGCRSGWMFNKSLIASAYDFASGNNIELYPSGCTFIMDEASASDDFTVTSGTSLSISASITHTFDPNANMTITGLLNMTGANITTSSGYFDLYNPGQVWLNDSEVNSSDLALPFSFYIGSGANSTVNNYTGAMSGQDMLLTISSESYANKGAGIVWHMNATLTSCSSCFESVKFLFGNLTATESYRLYDNGALVGTETADADGDVFFTTLIDDTADHLNLTYYSGVPAPPVPGTWVDILPVIVQIRYEYNIFSEVRVRLVINESYPVMDYYVWRTEDGRSWITFTPYLNFSEPWEMRSDTPLYVTVRNIEGVPAEISTTVKMDHTWLFILLFTIILCVTVSYLVSSRYKVIVRKLNKEVKW